MKTLIRWTISENCNPIGKIILKESIYRFKKLYPNFDYVVNDPDPNSLPYPPIGPAHKLYPPRLRLNSHEIFIDNDLIIIKHIPKLDKFLAQEDAFIYTEGLFHPLNSGFFGLPPNFDFKQAIIAEMKSPWQDHFHEQRIVSKIILAQQNLIPINTQEIQICHEGLYSENKLGYHFVGVNRGDTRAYQKHRRIPL